MLCYARSEARGIFLRIATVSPSAFCYMMSFSSVLNMHRKMSSCYMSDKISGCTLLPTQEIEVHSAKTVCSKLESCLR